MLLQAKPHLTNKIVSLLISLFVLAGPMAQATGPGKAALEKNDVIFEGYYKILSGGAHVGFVIQKYEYNPTTKNFISTAYIKSNQLAGGTSESVKAIANNKFQPISYQYTGQLGKKLLSIDAKFKNGKMTIKTSDGKRGNKSVVKIKSGVFLSTFLGYLMLQKGIKVGQRYNYNAIAEEDGKIYKGKSLFKSKTTVAGQTVYKVLNTFRDTHFISYFTEKAEVISTHSPVQHIKTQLVSSPDKATKGFNLDVKSLRLLFGNLPRGKINSLAQLKNKKRPTQTLKTPNKMPHKSPLKKNAETK